jgi:hypothetical protein
MAERRRCLFECQPEQVVDLVTRFETPSQRLHQPVAGDLALALAVEVDVAAKRAQQLAAKAGLLFDLAQRGLLRRLTQAELAEPLSV